MKKEIVRREFLKLKQQGYTYQECQEELFKIAGRRFGLRTLKYWQRRLWAEEWDLRDTSQRPHTIHHKFDGAVKALVVNLRKEYGYSAQKMRIKLLEKSISMSEPYIKQIIKRVGLSRGNKMEGMTLAWVRFERPDPNYLWQLDGKQFEDGVWILPIVDDCSRYCPAVMRFQDMTTENVIALLEIAIAMHGKPRQILTDNGSEFGGTSKDSVFDKWCEKQGIEHIRSGIHKPTTVGKVSALQKTIMLELPYAKGDLELWRMRYNHERPHESLHGLTPARVYFQYRRHKKHYEL